MSLEPGASNTGVTIIIVIIIIIIIIILIIIEVHSCRPSLEL